MTASPPLPRGCDVSSAICCRFDCLLRDDRFTSILSCAMRQKQGQVVVGSVGDTRRGEKLGQLRFCDLAVVHLCGKPEQRPEKRLMRSAGSSVEGQPLQPIGE